MKTVAMISLILAFVGALNWGLVGLFKVDLVAMVTGAKKFGEVNMLSRIIYVVVAIAGIYALVYYIGLSK
jgi:uncharacterized membrane protein YuzA (DUF378 family)